MLRCGWVEDGDAETCGAEAQQTYHLALCVQHAVSFTSTREYLLQRFVHEHILRYDSPGWTYIVLMSNGNYKIGFSRDEANLTKRFSSLSNKGGAVTPLCVVPGGRTQELRLHRMFRDARVPGYGEEFYPASEIGKYAKSNGIHPMVKSAVDRYLRARACA